MTELPSRQSETTVVPNMYCLIVWGVTSASHTLAAGAPMLTDARATRFFGIMGSFPNRKGRPWRNAFQGFAAISAWNASHAFSNPTFKSAIPSVPAARSCSKRRATSAYRASTLINFRLRARAEKAGAAERIVTDRLSSLAFPWRRSPSVLIMYGFIIAMSVTARARRCSKYRRKRRFSAERLLHVMHGRALRAVPLVAAGRRPRGRFRRQDRRRDAGRGAREPEPGDRSARRPRTSADQSSLQAHRLQGRVGGGGAAGHAGNLLKLRRLR